MFFPVIEVNGSPYDIGLQHGLSARPYIENAIETYTEAFNTYANMNWNQAKIQSRKFIPFIEAYDKDLMDEIRGIADGAGKDLEDIAALNSRSEIWFNGKRMADSMDGCTAFAATPDATRYGNTLLGQTWDWKVSIKKSLIALKIIQNNKPDIFMVTEAGIIGKIGFNSAGLGVCLNALATDERPEGVPLHVILRGILNCETLNDAVYAAGKARIGCAANFLLAHKDGEAIDIEAWPGDFDVLYPEDGLIVHTNHFTSPRSILLKDTGKLSFPDTFIRYGRIKNFLKKSKGNVDLNLMKRFYADHVGYPDSICRHEDLRDEAGLRVGTVFSMLMDLERNEMFVAPGTPCTEQYEIYRF